MKPADQKEAKEKINAAIDDIISYLEESRFYPSVREAGTAVTESAVTNCADIVFKLVEDLLSYSMVKGDLSKGYSLEEIIAILKETEDDKVSNVIEDFDDLEEIDSFDGEFDRKYRVINTIYKHKPTGEHIRVTEQRSNDSYELTLDVQIELTEKKEIITTEWA